MGVRQLIVVATSLFLGCNIVDPSYYQALATNTDSGMQDVDSGIPGPAETCGDTNARVLADTTRMIRIDTTQAADNVRASCTGHASEGNDLFFAIDVAAGEYWHFHLQADPSDPASASRNPSLYLLTSACNDRACQQSSDVCDGNSDEHFAFVADSAGTWYLGIDDRNSGGGRYILEAIRPSCGNGIPEHGEACDDGNLIDGDGCDAKCRWELSTAILNEQIPNDNVIEANRLRMGTGESLTIRGDIGGPDCYPDVFVMRIVSGLGRVKVTALDPAGTVCANATTAPFHMELRNAMGQLRGGGEDSNGCPVIDVAALAAGEFFIWIRAKAVTTTPVQYRLKFELL